MLEEQKEAIPEPAFTKTIENIFQSVVDFIIYFPYVFLKILTTPDKIFQEDFKIRPLTFFAVCLVLTSQFWYAYNNQGLFVFIAYVEDPEFSNTLNLFLNTSELGQILLNMIPIIILIILLTSLIEYLLGYKNKETSLLQFNYYLLGIVLISYPSIFFVWLFSVKKITVLMDYDALAMGVLYGVIIILTLAIFRIIWKGAIYFQKIRGWHGLLKFAGMLVIFSLMCYYTPTMPAYFYKLKDNYKIKSTLIKDLILTKSNDTALEGKMKDSLIVKFFITNFSEVDQVIKLKTFKLTLGPDKLSYKNNFESVQYTSEPVKPIFILKGKSTILLQVPFVLPKNDSAEISALFQDKKNKDGTYILGKTNISLSFEDQEGYAEIQPSMLKDIEYSDLK